HDAQDSYVKQNGLLSQWRAYGGAYRYALVFDCHSLFDLLDAETNQFKYSFYQFCEAIYAGEEGVDRKRLSNMIRLLCLGYDALVRENLDHTVTEETRMEFMQSVTRFKHRGFKEEREVRIVVSPWTPELLNKLGDDPEAKNDPRG